MFDWFLVLKVKTLFHVLFLPINLAKWKARRAKNNHTCFGLSQNKEYQPWHQEGHSCQSPPGAKAWYGFSLIQTILPSKINLCWDPINPLEILLPRPWIYFSLNLTWTANLWCDQMGHLGFMAGTSCCLDIRWMKCVHCLVCIADICCGI